MKSLRLFAALAVVVGGCGGGDSSGAPDAAGAPDAEGSSLLAPPPDGEGIQIEMQANIGSGEEQFYCQYYVLPAGAGVDVGKFEHAYTEGSHHMLLFPTTLTAAEVATDQAMFPCSSRGDLKTLGVAYGAQTAAGDLAYPDGVAMHFDSEAVVLLQAHYINATEQPIDADVRVNLWYATSTVTQYAGTLFYYDWAILVPPAPGTATVHMRCVVPSDINVLFASSHMHRRGVGYRSALSGGALGSPMTLHDTDQWEAPDPTTFQPALQISAGQVIDYECDYQNDLAQTVTQGPSADVNEMCMFVASYYPKMPDAAEFCFQDGDGPRFDGSKTCSESLTCIQGAATDAARQQCMMDTCAGSNDAFDNFINCLVVNNCVGDPTCVATYCGAQYNACNSATCL